jgi:hypothetical protein
MATAGKEQAMTEHHTATNRRRLLDSLAGRVGSALAAWSERSHALDPRVARLDELNELRESARAGLRL